YRQPSFQQHRQPSFQNRQPGFNRPGQRQSGGLVGSIVNISILNQFILNNVGNTTVGNNNSSNSSVDATNGVTQFGSN
ncbi:MAG TPA: hypothetical protein VN408_26025, partial [Actinoplanes sp.]|nr:hypothetical protein [Actinoplanes sp.]